MQMQYADEDYKKQGLIYAPQLMDQKKMIPFIGQKANELRKILQENYPEIRSVKYKVECWRGEWTKKLILKMDHSITNEECHDIESVIKNFQKKMAKEFNSAAFSTTQYGSVKFSSGNMTLYQLI